MMVIFMLLLIFSRRPANWFGLICFFFNYEFSGKLFPAGPDIPADVSVNCNDYLRFVCVNNIWRLNLLLYKYLSERW